jgi:hypothetical protein
MTQLSYGTGGTQKKLSRSQLDHASVVERNSSFYFMASVATRGDLSYQRYQREVTQ